MYVERFTVHHVCWRIYSSSCMLENLQFIMYVGESTVHHVYWRIYSSSCMLENLQFIMYVGESTVHHALDYGCVTCPACP